MNVEQAIWEGNVKWLEQHHGCRCCCSEHSFGHGCPAYAWGGCRGQYSVSDVEEESWARHYELFHGMTRAQFFGG